MANQRFSLAPCTVTTVSPFSTLSTIYFFTVSVPLTGIPQTVPV
jgi:hypothetical protein